ncbi:MAG: NADPH-dependent FMN reductase [Euzebya sp.]
MSPQPDPSTIRVLAIPGSLRAQSLNRLLLEAVAQDPPEGITITVGSISGLPVFDQDLEAENNGGPVVAALRDAVRQADALLVATPEYNQSIPGGLKNAIDWLSREPDEVLDGKPVAVTGVTPGSWGTRYAQAAVRHTLSATGCMVMTSPMLFIRQAAGSFTDGSLTDDRVRDHLNGLLVALGQWTRLTATADAA